MAAEELVVKALPEGFGETNDKLETTDEKFEEVSGSMEESTGLLSSLSNKFGGALSAIVAGVAVATAGLLSQVPILGEVVSGLSSVISAVAFQLDKRLRPVLGPVRDGLFELAQAIFEGNFGKAESIIKDFVDAIASIDFGAVFASITDAVDGILVKIQDAFDGRTAGGIVDQIFGLLGGFVSFAVNRVAGFIQDVIKALSGTETDNVLAEFLVDTLDALSDFAISATNKIVSFLGGLNYSDIVNTIIGGLISVSETLTNGIVDVINSINWNKITSKFASEFGSSIKDGYNSAISQAQESITGIFLPDEFMPSDASASTTDTTTPTSQVGGNTGNTNGNGSIYLDGHDMSERLSRYGHNGVTSRGGATGL
ncbi:hypothetical protein 7841G1D8_21 [Haloquadratum phage sp.]|nr:hypothetical protein 7841G1D8_21 [Haloquadratum phage sp.]